MSTTLENTNYINNFDDKLKSYNNLFFKTLQDYDLLKETTDIKNSANALNISSGSTYATAQFNNFIRNIINFKIKNYTDLTANATDTNLEFVKKLVSGGTTTYAFNTDVKQNIIDTLKILNVFVDILEAYKHCIDKDVTTINSGYFDDIVIDRIEVVSSGTRFYPSSSAVPDVNTYKNVGYIRNTRTSGSVGAKNVLYLSIQSFYTGLTTANYNDIFDKNNISGDYNAGTSSHNNITTQIFNATDTVNPSSTLQNLELAKKDYARHYYDTTITTIQTSGLTRVQRNKNVVSLLLKCLFNIDPKFRKQSVYALYYYYKFVQLYATLIINVSNVMFADVSHGSNPKRIDSYNTGTASSVTAIEVITPGVGYPLSKSDNSISVSGGGASADVATANAASDASGNIPSGSSAINITNNGSGYTSAPTANIATAPKIKGDAQSSANLLSIGASGASGASGAYTTALSNYDTAVNDVRTEISNLIGRTLTADMNTALRISINTSLTAGNYAASVDSITRDTAKSAAGISGSSTLDAYINALIAERKAFLSGVSYYSAQNAVNAAYLNLIGSTLPDIVNTALRTSINNQLTSANYDNNGAFIGTTPTDATIRDAAKNATSPITTGTTLDAYIDKLIAERHKFLIKEKKLLLKIAAANAVTSANDMPTDTPATFIATIVPLAYENETKTQDGNIERLKAVIADIETKITALTTSIRDAADPATEESFVILNSSNAANIKKSADDNVLIMIPKTNTNIYNKLIKYKEINDIVENCSIYDTKNKKYYDILNISTISLSGVDYFAIELKAVFIKDAAKEYYDIFYDSNAAPYASAPDAIQSLTIGSGDFLQIKRKDINALKNKYVDKKKTIDTLNTNISLNTNRVNNQKNLYETQYNKNVFLSRQILTYNILICTIVVVLIGINVINMDKPLVKSISLACLGIIILLFVIYFMSNITYIETFAMSDDNLAILKNNPSVSDLATRNTKKVSALKTEIDKLNQQFIKYFETIMIKLPTADSNDFYREITSVINADIENKTYLDKILDFNKSQGNTNMDTLKYELENNKLYILTLLISAIIFIGLYNIYINYIDNDKYLSLMIFIAIIIFIVIGAYYIINSNRRVRTIHKNIYWGPQSSENF